MHRYLSLLGHTLWWGFSSWLIISSFSITAQEVEIINGAEQMRVVRNTSIMYQLALFLSLIFLGFYLNLWLWKRDFPLRQKILSTIAITFAACCLYYLLVHLMFERELPYPPLSLVLGIAIFYMAISSTLASISLVHKTEIKRKAVELQNKQKEMELLRNQLHPHFLFNALNNLMSMVNAEESPKLNQAIATLSSVLRYSVYESTQTQISLSREIENIRDFISIYKLRFEDEELEYSEQISGDIASVNIEPGLLIPLVENAVKFGIFPERRGFISLGVDIGQETLSFNLRNSIVEDKTAVHSGGVGLNLTRKRLALSYGNNQSFEARRDGNEFVVSLILPKQ